MAFQISDLLAVSRCWDTEDLLRRVWYEAQKKTGTFQWRLKSAPWQAVKLSDWVTNPDFAQPEHYHQYRLEKAVGRFFFDGTFRNAYLACVNALPLAPNIEEAHQIAQGRFRFFNHAVADCGHLPNWHCPPQFPKGLSAAQHWSTLSTALSEGDIKLVWELSRFGWVYPLIRAYWVTHDTSWCDLCLTLIDNWKTNNPPYRGPNWLCGQETSFRVMALCGVFYAFLPVLTPQQVADLALTIAVHAQRIAKTLVYARSQKNNHALSEAAALWSVGLLFPEFKRASFWRKTGRSVLEKEAARQIYPDGAYIQHSANYHRLMLHDCLWAMRLGECNDAPFSQPLYDAIDRATSFLYQLQDAQTGRVPNFGANDGALILPFNTCDYIDFRPVLQAAHYLVHRKRLYDVGPYDEDLIWLFGDESTENTQPERPPRTSLTASHGGYYTLRGKRTWALMRCATYRDRPCHADQLHVDLWWRGINIAQDAGAYLYSGAPPWNNGLSGTAVHNTVLVDDQDQMTQKGRFLWTNWSKGTFNGRRTSPNGYLDYMEGEHDGYCKQSVTHRRGVLRVGENTWCIIDDLFGSSGVHSAALHWLLPDLCETISEAHNCLVINTPRGPLSVTVWSSCPGKIQVLRSGEPVADTERQSTRPTERFGWVSHHYADKQPACSLRYELKHTLPVRLITLFTSGKNAKLQVRKNTVSFQKAHRLFAECQLNDPGAGSILQTAQFATPRLNESLSHLENRMMQ